MHGRNIESIAALRRALGATSPPSTITQEAFDQDDDHLHRLVKLKPGEPAKTGDLWDYSQDLRYTQIEREQRDGTSPSSPARSSHPVGC
jgi:hypothetical protein